MKKNISYYEEKYIFIWSTIYLSCCSMKKNGFLLLWEEEKKQIDSFEEKWQRCLTDFEGCKIFHVYLIFIFMKQNGFLLIWEEEKQIHSLNSNGKMLNLISRFYDVLCFLNLINPLHKKDTEKKKWGWTGIGEWCWCSIVNLTLVLSIMYFGFLILILL